MDGVGKSSLKITTTSTDAQAYFNQGLRLLHCFWEFEAYRAFKEAARLDAAAPMPYWGIAEALGNIRSMKEERKAALDKAKSLTSKASEHEQYYLRAQSAIADVEDEKAKAAYRREMETVIDRYPDDLDAQAFLALFEMGGYEQDGRPREGTIYGQALLRNILTSDPDNAAANHYWIHAVEGGSHPEAALPSAEILGRLAPNSGHMVHMPGHIYYRTGQYEKARQSFIDSTQVDEAYMAAQKITPEEDWNYGHNLSYLVAACAEAGRYKEGLQWAQKLEGLHTGLVLGGNNVAYAIFVGSSLTRLHIRFGDWQAAASDHVEFGVDPTSATRSAGDYQEGLSYYAKGMSALEKGDAADSLKQAEALDALLWRLEAEKPKSKDEGMDKKDDSEVQDNPEGVLGLLGTASLDLRGNIESVAGRHEQAVKLLKLAEDKEKDLGYREPPSYSRPEFESLGYAYLRAHEWQNARDAFNQELRERPQTGFALYGIAQSYALAGQVKEANDAYKSFLESWAHPDGELPQVQQARAWLTSHGQ
jgi:tetratricopeptide (TPR) repeat protein